MHAYVDSTLSATTLGTSELNEGNLCFLGKTWSHMVVSKQHEVASSHLTPCAPNYETSSHLAPRSNKLGHSEFYDFGHFYMNLVCYDSCNS